MKRIIVAILVLLFCSLTIGSSGLYLREEAFYQRYGVSAEGLVLWLDMTDGRSYGNVGNWYDMSGNGNHATQGTGANQPAITGAVGLAGSCRDFDGNDWMAKSTNVITNYPFTLAVWVQTNVGGTLLSLNDASNFRVYQAISISPPTGFARATSRNGIPVSHAVSSDDIRDSQFHQMIGVFTSRTDRKIYVDGTLKATNTTDTTFSGDIDVALIGRLRLIDAPDYFDGNIPVCKIFSRALSAAEVQRLYLADAPRHGGL